MNINKRVILWFRGMKLPSVVFGFALGTLSVVFLMLFEQQKWVIDYQGMIGAGMAVMAAAWTISLTVLHRNEDKFQEDAAAFRSLSSRIQTSKVHPLEMLEKTSAFKHLPEEVRLFSYHTALLWAEDTSHKPQFVKHQQKCVKIVKDWFDNCIKEKRYIEFRSNMEPKALFIELSDINEGVSRNGN